jgi:hypothetical protein
MHAQEQATQARLAAVAAQHDAEVQRVEAQQQVQLQATTQQLLQPVLSKEELEAIRAAALETAQVRPSGIVGARARRACMLPTELPSGAMRAWGRQRAGEGGTASPCRSAHALQG